MNTAAAVKILTVVMFAVAAVAAAAYLFLMRSKKEMSLRSILNIKDFFTPHTFYAAGYQRLKIYAKNKESYRAY